MLERAASYPNNLLFTSLTSSQIACVQIRLPSQLYLPLRFGGFAYWGSPITGSETSVRAQVHEIYCDLTVMFIRPRYSGVQD
jgi:hypothetical protein